MGNDYHYVDWRFEASDYLVRDQNEYFRLILIATGEGNLETKGRGHLMGPGSWFILLPDISYVMLPKDGTGIAYYEVNFETWMKSVLLQTE
ncbi:AraC family ligand binding domain-containing protein [Paenibacillus pinihumi]|uniref:AraC family ligand binding domain-containing protein n=1 Tax=Paenibacillus pinihumi TaxID=669462 RepID=UPI002481053D|nr:AraC family ligand binding domain-containing protein [Paenibacillus pinihumi]